MHSEITDVRPRKKLNLTIKREYKTFFYVFQIYLSHHYGITAWDVNMLYYSGVILLCYYK